MTDAPFPDDLRDAINGIEPTCDASCYNCLTGKTSPCRETGSHVLIAVCPKCGPQPADQVLCHGHAAGLAVHLDHGCELPHVQCGGTSLVLTLAAL